MTALPNNTNYQICNRCVMDTTDPNIFFDEQGNCQYCNGYMKLDFTITAEKKAHLNSVIEQIKADGRGKPYDCIIGVSGGVDSTYVAYAVKNFGLRPLAVHLDNGWNSELAVANIEKTLQKLDIDLYTHVIDWNEFRDLQMSFLKASVPGMEIPTDHGIISILNQVAARHNVKYIVNGSNASSEHIMSNRWSESEGQRDWLLVKNVHRQFGKAKLKTFPRTTIFNYFYYKLVKKLTVINILNHIDYNKESGKALIEKELGWIYYGGKHYESIYTRFTQAYIQPRKFNIDKRKAHHSNLICSGEMTRAEALANLAEDAYPSEEMREKDKAYFIKKMEMTEAEFEEMMNAPTKSYLDYKGYFNNSFYKALYSFAFSVHNILKGFNYYGKRAD